MATPREVLSQFGFQQAAIPDGLFQAALTPIQVGDDIEPNIGGLRALFEAAASAIEGGTGVIARRVAQDVLAEDRALTASLRDGAPVTTVDIFAAPATSRQPASLVDLFALAGETQDAGVSGVNSLEPIRGVGPEGGGAVVLLALAGAIEFLG